MSIKDTGLKDSPANDVTLMQLVSELEACSREHGDCENCGLLRECRRAWDLLAERKLYNKLTDKEHEQFRVIFRSLKRQAVLC